MTAVIEKTTSSVNTTATFSTTLPNGQKMTINSGVEELEFVSNQFKDLPIEERLVAAEKVRDEMIENTDNEDKEQLDKEISEMASSYEQPKEKYSVPAKLEYTIDEDEEEEKIEPKTRQAYVWYFLSLIHI